MPKQTFINLDSNKQNRIINAALEEFSRAPFNQATVKNIIEKANIPRGSFYQYFTGLEDIFYYLLEYIHKDRAKKMDDIIKQNDGDLFKVMRIIYVEKLNFMKKYNSLFKNIFTHFSKESNHFEKTHFCEMKKSLDNTFKNINISNYKYKNLNEIIYLINVIQMTLIKQKEEHNLTIQQVLKKYDEYIDIIKYGVLKEEINE